MFRPSCVLRDRGRKQPAAERHSELRVVAQAGTPLEHDEGADALARERVRRLDHLVDEVAPLLARAQAHALEETTLAEAREGPPQLGLEEDDQGQHPERPEVVEQPARAEQLEVAGQERGHHEAGQAQEHLHRARLLEHHEDAVEHDRHQHDVDRVARTEGLEHRPHG
jgi:hypothetical protein